MPGTQSKIDVTDPMQVAMHLATLTSTMQSMQRESAVQAEANRIAIAALDAKIGTVSDALHGFSQVRYDTAAHSESLARLWTADKDRRTETKAALDRANRILWMGTGAGAVIGLLIVLVCFLYIRDQESFDGRIKTLSERIEDKSGKLDERQDRVEIYLAGDRTQSFKR